MIRRLWRAPLFSPTGLMLRAGVLWLAYGAAHLAGWRECTSILCGTLPGGWWAQLAGVIYVALHFTAVVACPILVIAAGLLVVVKWVWRD